MNTKWKIRAEYNLCTSVTQRKKKKIKKKKPKQANKPQQHGLRVNNLIVIDEQQRR